MEAIKANLLSHSDRIFSEVPVVVEVRDPGRRRRRGFGVADAQIATRADRASHTFRDCATQSPARSRRRYTGRPPPRSSGEPRKGPMTGSRSPTGHALALRRAVLIDHRQRLTTPAGSEWPARLDAGPRCSRRHMGPEPRGAPPRRRPDTALSNAGTALGHPGVELGTHSAGACGSGPPCGVAVHDEFQDVVDDGVPAGDL